jgi:Malectin domain
MGKNMSKRILLYYVPSDQFIADQMIELLNHHDITVVSQHHFPDVLSYLDVSGIQQADGYIIIISEMALKSLSLRSIITKLGNQQGQSPLIPFYVNPLNELQAQEGLDKYSPLLWDPENSETVFQQVLHRLAEHSEVTSTNGQQDSPKVADVQENNAATYPLGELPPLQATLTKLRRHSEEYQHNAITHEKRPSRYRLLFFVGSILLLSVILITIFGLHSNKTILGRKAPFLPSPLATVSSSASMPISQGTPPATITTPTTTMLQPTSQPLLTATPHQVSSVTPSPTIPSFSLYINAGGPAFPPFSADTDYSGGSSSTTSKSVSTSGVINSAPGIVYQSIRVGSSFKYVIPGLTPGSAYTVRLHFAEIYWASAGKRVFNVALNNTPVLSNFDILATAGSANQAVVEQFITKADSSGAITIQFTSVIDQAQVNGIEIN